jgi:hypothetical protein
MRSVRYSSSTALLVLFTIILLLMGTVMVDVGVNGQETTTTTTTTTVAPSDQDVTGDTQCTICSSADQSNSNPDTTITYNWTPRVPVGSSEVSTTEETMTCAQFESKLIGGFSAPEMSNECTQHQGGVQAAGCACASSTDMPSSSTSTFSPRYAKTMIVTATTILLVLSSSLVTVP